MTFGYALIALAGAVTLGQSMRAPHQSHQDGAHALTASIGLLPCPLTISVLGFSWAQSHGVMFAVVILSLALGLSLTIGLVAVLAIAARHALGASAGLFFAVRAIRAGVASLRELGNDRHRGRRDPGAMAVDRLRVSWRPISGASHWPASHLASGWQE